MAIKRIADATISPMDMGWQMHTARRVMDVNRKLLRDNFSAMSKYQLHFDDMQLQVGARLQLILATPGRPAFSSSLIGYVANEYLLVTLPLDHGRTVPMREGEQVTVRVFSGVSVYTFACVVESVLLAPHDYMHLSFPREIAATVLRQYTRVKVSLPMEVLGADSTHREPVPAMLSDLSVAGALVMAEEGLGQPGDRISVSFAFRVQPTNQEVRIHSEATICSARRQARHGGQASVLLGVRFDSVSENEQFLLQHFLYEAENVVTH